MIKVYLKALIPYVFSVATFPIRCVPIRKKRILFSGLTGGKTYDYSCNPKYIYEYVKKNARQEYEMVWLVSDVSKYYFLKEQGTKLAKHFSIKAFYYLLTSKVIVTNGSYAPWVPFRKKQYVINTWHGGGAYKKIENEKPNANWATKKRAQFCADNIDLFVASCKMQEEQMIRTSYSYKGEVLKVGTPRNDQLVRKNDVLLATKVKKQFGFDVSDRIVLYAPTYRNADCKVVLDADQIIEQCSKQYGSENDKWHFFCKHHRYDTADSPIVVYGKDIMDVADYPDMQELLCAADVLITDYSSCVWDFALLEKPCFLFVPDREQYERETGFYVGLDQWPFDKAENMEQLVQLIKCFDNDKQRSRVAEHMKVLGSYETGDSCKVIFDRIEAICSI